MSVRSRILLVSADGPLARRLSGLLEEHACRVRTVATVEEALRAGEQSVFDVVIFAPAVDRPDEAIARLGEATRSSLIVLTRMAGVAVARALEAGADDAIAPPYANEEIVARLALALRRPRPAAAREVLDFGDVSLDLQAHEVRVGGHLLMLTPLEYRLLEALVRARGHAVLHADLLSQVWGAAHRGHVHYLRVYIARLRRKLESRVGWRTIVHVSGVGYRIAAPDENM